MWDQIYLNLILFLIKRYSFLLILIQNNLPYNHTEGKRGDSKWILVDAEEVIIHIFEKNERDVYNLDLLWGDQPKINYQKYI